MPFSSSNAPYPANEPLPSGNAFSVLVVEDQGSVRAALVAELRRAGVSDIFEAPEGQAALHLFKTHRPDLVLLDIKLPGQDGYWVAQQMRESEAGDWTPIIFLSGLDNELDVWRGIEVGGDDYLVKPVKPIVLMAKLRAMRRLLDMRRRLVSMSAELHAANQRLNEMVEIDALTGLVNRRGFDRILHNEILAARRDGTPLTLMLCDLDHFKLFNDASGHVQWMMENCPNTRLVLGGYSQGAAVMDVIGAIPVPGIGFNNPLPPEAAGHVAAIAVFGNPSAKLGLPLTASPVWGGKVIDLCNAGDPI